MYFWVHSTVRSPYTWSTKSRQTVVLKVGPILLSRGSNTVASFDASRVKLLYRHFGTIATNAWTCGQSQMPKLWHGARIPSGLAAKVKMAKMTKM